VIFGDLLKIEAFIAGARLLHAFGSHIKLHRISWILLPLLLNSPAIAQNAKPETDAGHAAKAAESPIKFEGISYVSGNRRDPFVKPKPIHKTEETKATKTPKASKEPVDEEIPRGVPPPGIAGASIAQAVLEGISISAGRRIAVLRGAESRSYFLKEGDRLFDGYIKSILDDSITFVRETKMKSGKTLTQDITKRLRTP
jgi:hypothetical protein